LARGFKEKPPDIQLDIRSVSDAVTNFDLIFHSASTVNDYNLLDGSAADTETNLVGTQALLEACRRYNPWVRIVFISTFFVVGDPPQNPVTEDVVCRPKGLYGATKLAAEHFTRIYRDVYGLDTVIARCTNLYGPHQPTANQKTAAFNWMCKTCVEDGVIPLYDNGQSKRDYLFIEDALSALTLIADEGREDLYFVGSGIPYSFREMVLLMQAEAGGGTILPVTSPGFHSRVGIGDFWIDNEKTRRLGWEPIVDIKRGIRKTIQWYRSRYGKDQ
jgi:nucleoside-diphosphate-sugar epimerase